MKEIYIIDTGIFMYARSRGHHYKKSCEGLVIAIGSGSFEQKYGQPVIDSELFQEILYRYSLINRKDKAISLLQNIYDLGLDIFPVDKAEVEKMIELAARYKNENITPRDIVHAAVMLTNDIKNIISVDRDFDRISEIKRIDPIELMDQ